MAEQSTSSSSSSTPCFFHTHARGVYEAVEFLLPPLHVAIPLFQADHLRVLIPNPGSIATKIDIHATPPTTPAMLEPYWLATYQPRITLTTRTTRALTGKPTSPLVARLATT